MSKTKTAAPTTTVVRENVKALMYVTESGMTFVGLNDADILGLFGLGDTANRVESSVVAPRVPRTVEIEKPKIEESAPPAPTSDKPEKFPGQHALLAKLKATGYKQKGLHFLKKENLEALIIEKGGSTTTTAIPPKPARVEPRQRTETPQKPKKKGGFGGRSFKKGGDGGDTPVRVPANAFWAEYLTKKEKWMDVLVIGEEDGKYIVFNPSQDDDADLPDGWMKGMKWKADKDRVRFAD